MVKMVYIYTIPLITTSFIITTSSSTTKMLTIVALISGTMAIGDTPYDIPGDDNQDRYSLMKPYGKVPLYVKIKSPQEDFLYFKNQKIMPFFTTLIIGHINITVIAFDESGIDRVEFYIDDKLKSTITSPPYYWMWKEIKFFKHTIKAIAFNSTGNYKSDEITVWKFF
jgi:hypothetical protein